MRSLNTFSCSVGFNENLI